LNEPIALEAQTMNKPTPAEMRLIVELDELKQRMATLARENATLRVQRDAAMAKVMSLLPIATPEEEEEMRQLMATAVPLDLEKLIAELEAGRSPS
jgi:hypothetical protein